MSQTIDYVFNCRNTLEELSEMLQAELGVNLTPCDTEAANLCGRLLAMDFYVGLNDYENDRDLQFEDYRYCVGLKTYAPQDDLRPLQVSVMAAMPYLLSRLVGASGMLVFDAQRQIGLYESRVGAGGQEELLDVTSGNVVHLPELFASVSSRLRGHEQGTDDAA